MVSGDLVAEPTLGRTLARCLTSAVTMKALTRGYNIVPPIEHTSAVPVAVEPLSNVARIMRVDNTTVILSHNTPPLRWLKPNR